MCVLFWALETRTEEVTCSVDFDYCLVCCCAWAASFPRPIRQDFDSPFDLAPLSERALGDFGQVHLIPQRTPGAGLHASHLLRPGLQGPKRMRTRFMEDVAGVGPRAVTFSFSVSLAVVVFFLEALARKDFVTWK